MWLVKLLCSSGLPLLVFAGSRPPPHLNSLPCCPQGCPPLSRPIAGSTAYALGIGFGMYACTQWTPEHVTDLMPAGACTHWSSSRWSGRGRRRMAVRSEAGPCRFGPAAETVGSHLQRLPRADYVTNGIILAAAAEAPEVRRWRGMGRTEHAWVAWGGAQAPCALLAWCRARQPTPPIGPCITSTLCLLRHLPAGRAPADPAERHLSGGPHAQRAGEVLHCTSST